MPTNLPEKFEALIKAKRPEWAAQYRHVNHSVFTCYEIPCPNPSRKPAYLDLVFSELEVAWVLGYHEHLEFGEPPEPGELSLESAVNMAIEILDAIFEERYIVYRKFVRGKLTIMHCLYLDEGQEATEAIAELKATLKRGHRIELASWTGKYDQVIER